MSKAIITESHLTDIANAIIAKGGADAPLKPSEMAAAIAAIPSGGNEVEPKDVDLFDVDGKRIHSYTFAELDAIVEFPAPPQIEGLVSQGWNYTVSEAKAMGRKCIVGATYTTDNGDTRLRISIPSASKLRNIKLNIGTSTANTVTVDWGDGSEREPLPLMGLNEISHTYDLAGEYVISMSPNGSDFTLGQNMYSSPFFVDNIGNQFLTEANLGSHVSLSVGREFMWCSNLLRVTLPQSLTEIPSGYTFEYSGIRMIAMPHGLEKLGYGIFSLCFALKHVSIPATTTSIGLFVDSCFGNCYALEELVIPYSVTTLYGVGSRLRKVTSFVVPPGVLSFSDLSQSFYEWFSLVRVVFDGSPTQIEYATFLSCHSLEVVDMRNCVEVPALLGFNTFPVENTFYKIVVPDALYDEWIAATNWSDASIVGHIVKESEYVEA